MNAVGILDYGAGNLKNVCRAVDHLGFEYVLISKPDELINSTRLIIPGVGAFKAAMESMDRNGFIGPIKEYAASGKPVLGICLGMQMLFDKSFEFGESPGLGLISGKVEAIPTVGANGIQHKIPHIGWNELNLEGETDTLFKDIPSLPAAYFVHSFMAVPDDERNLIAFSLYNNLKITAAVRNKNVIGCQFHPEKSGSIGLKMLSNFLTS